MQPQSYMSAIPTTLVDILDFSKSANEYYERAKNGERIFITIDGRIEQEVFTDVEQSCGIFDECSRPEMTPVQYETLLDILDPLD